MNVQLMLQLKAVRSAALALAAQAEALLTVLDAAAAKVAADMEAPKKPVCAACGSPRWTPGGMGDLYRKCSDCGALGDEIRKS